MSIVKYNKDGATVVSTKREIVKSDDDGNSEDGGNSESEDEEQESEQEDSNADTQVEEAKPNKISKVFDEPVDPEAIEYHKRGRPTKEIDLNAPPGKTVLLEGGESPKEFDEMEDKIKVMDSGIKKSNFFSPYYQQETQNQPLKLENWEQHFEEIIKKVSNKKNIPILSINNIAEFQNISRLQSLVNTFRKYNKFTTLLAVGPLFIGSGFDGCTFEGKNIIDLLNKVKADFICLDRDDWNVASIHERITEFKQTILASNLQERQAKIYRYTIRKFGDFNVLFLALTNSEKAKDFEASIKELKQIKANLHDKYNFSVLLNSTDFSTEITENILDLNLILSAKVRNTIYSISNTKYCSADAELKSVVLNIINKTTGNIESILIPLDYFIPQDPEIKIFSEYWVNLAYKELKTFNKVDPSLSIGEIKTPVPLLKFLIRSIELFLEEEKITAHVICLDKSLSDKSLHGKIKGYHLYKFFPKQDNLVLFTIPVQTYKEISNNFNLTNTVLLKGEITDSVTLVTTEESLNLHILDHIEGGFSAQVYLDIRTLLLNTLLNLLKK